MTDPCMAYLRLYYRVFVFSTKMVDELDDWIFLEIIMVSIRRNPWMEKTALDSMGPWRGPSPVISRACYNSIYRGVKPPPITHL